jgi:hypothetical protein
MVAKRKIHVLTGNPIFMGLLSEVCMGNFVKVLDASFLKVVHK